MWTKPQTWSGTAKCTSCMTSPSSNLSSSCHTSSQLMANAQHWAALCHVCCVLWVLSAKQEWHHQDILRGKLKQQLTHENSTSRWAAYQLVPKQHESSGWEQQAKKTKKHKKLKLGKPGRRSDRLWDKCKAFEHWSDYLLNHHRFAPCVGDPSSMSELWRARVWGGVCAHYLMPSNIESLRPRSYHKCSRLVVVDWSYWICSAVVVDILSSIDVLYTLYILYIQCILHSTVYTVQHSGRVLMRTRRYTELGVCTQGAYWTRGAPSGGGPNSGHL